MKTLYEYIFESHGVVTGSNSWGRTVNFICFHKSTMVKDPKYLAPWMKSVKVDAVENQTGRAALAMYDDEHSTLEDGKLNVVIQVDWGLKKQLLKQSLHHELQHAFDDWIAKSKNKFFTTDYWRTSTGMEMEETSPFNLIYPDSANCDDFFNMFKYCTDFFEPTEINAYAREFDRYLGGRESLDITRLLNEDYWKNEAGLAPLAYINLLMITKDHIEKDDYIQDEDHVDYEYIAHGLQRRWVKQYLKSKNINGETGKETVLAAIDAVLKMRATPAFEKYRKIIEYRVQENGLKVQNFPSWWRQFK